MNSNPQNVRLLDIDENHTGQRLDNFLITQLKGVPKSRIYRLVRKGEVRVNRARVKPDYRLQAGDQVRIPPVRDGGERMPVQAPAAVRERLAAAVLWEDGDFLVLNKPAGIPVHKGSGQDFGVIETLRQMRANAGFLELVHRLDRDTSGCLLLAKNALSLKAAQAALRSDAVDKRYLVLVRGHWNLGSRRVDLPLRKNVLRGGERMVQVVADGKPALTCFEPITLLPQASLLEARIATGRTHQIRVHAAHLGHPVAGDGKYGDAGFNRQLAGLGLRRLFLHAHSLNLPIGERECSVSAPLDPVLREVLTALESKKVQTE